MKNLADIFDVHKKLIVAFIDGVRDEAYRQGRANAIDECIEAIEYCYTQEECKECLEELKEQK